MDEYEETFRKITQVVLGRKLSGLEAYGPWLTGKNASMAKTASALSGRPIYYPAFDFYHCIKDRLLDIEEAYNQVGKRQLSLEQVGRLTLANAPLLLKDISTTTTDTRYGKSSRLAECAVYYSSIGCFRTSLLNEAKYVLYSVWPRKAEYVAGCQYIFESSFCIKCYNSESLTRCFEMSDCHYCSDSMFCYNCDNVSNSMFCFNAKAKRYAIFNVEIGRERYMDLKASVMEELLARLEKDKRLDFDVFNLAKKGV